ncbi:MAG: metalloregulator ArsR/SmtB family transcription factor [Magnetococcales bacterium]|nr:metalloregulator ArsR/SmtB family transcription factor [Magnetococcales bacterium]
MKVENVLRVMADETRLRCLMLLVHETELCVCEMEQTLNEPQPKISRHLAVLRKANMVQDRRDGHWIYYRLHPQLPVWAKKIVLGAASGVAGQEPFFSDQQRLASRVQRADRCNGDGESQAQQSCA